MFNLGYKEIVLNSVKGVNGTVTNLSIEGYLSNLLNTQVVPFALVEPSVPAAKNVVDYETVVPPMPADAWGAAQTFAVGDAVEVEIKVRSLRNMSSLARDYIVDGKSIVFQSVGVPTNDAAGIATAIVDGYNLFNSTFQNGEQFFDLSVAGTTVKLTVKAGLEHVYAVSMGIKAVKSGGLPFTLLAATEVQAAFSGLGLGKFIEESRRMATHENIAPYAQQHGGNSQGVDVRGVYSQYLFEVNEPVTVGWEGHEYVDHSYVQAGMASTPTKYVIYANEASQPLIDELNDFFDGLVSP